MVPDLEKFYQIKKYLYHIRQRINTLNIKLLKINLKNTYVFLKIGD